MIGSDDPPAGLAQVADEQRLVEVGHLVRRVGVQGDADGDRAAAVVADVDVHRGVGLAGRRQEGDGQDQEDET